MISVPPSLFKQVSRDKRLCETFGGFHSHRYWNADERRVGGRVCRQFIGCDGRVGSAFGRSCVVTFIS